MGDDEPGAYYRVTYFITEVLTYVERIWCPNPPVGASKSGFLETWVRENTSIWLLVPRSPYFIVEELEECVTCGKLCASAEWYGAEVGACSQECHYAAQTKAAMDEDIDF